MEILTPKNISIIFTAYNIVEYLQLAIYSFLEFYPEYHDSIIVFDDQSTDKTKEWLQKENIKSITWKNTDNYIIQFSRLRKLFSNQTGLNASYRNSMMIKEIFTQIKTPYLMLNDADIIFTKGNWVEEYDKLIKDYKIIVPDEHYYYQWEMYKQFFNDKYIANKLQKYQSLYYFDKSNFKESMYRLHFFHSIIDLDYFKSINLLFDNTQNNLFIKLIYNNAIMDTGSDFSWEILNRNIPYYVIKNVYNRWKSYIENYIPITDFEFNNTYIYHARWISSYKRFQDEGIKDIPCYNTYEKIKVDFNNKLLFNWVNYLHKKYNTFYPEIYLGTL